MAKQQKILMSQAQKEILYDKEGFINWCVKHKKLSETAAKIYAADIITAYLTFFDEEDSWGVLIYSEK